MIYFMRHGLDDERFIGGHSDVSLVSEGVKQVEEARELIKNLKIKRIVSSDIKRAYETSLIVNELINVPIITDKHLRELDKGDLNGKRKDLISSNLINDIYTSYPNGESMLEFFNRIKKDLDIILSYENDLVVTHRGVINALYYILNHQEIDMDKEKFDIAHASIHEYNPKLKKIRRIY